jgi:hypothetical protein
VSCYAFAHLAHASGVPSGIDQIASISTLVVYACSGGSTRNEGLEPASGFCAEKCIKACDGDSECEISKGELCCDFGKDGKGCVAASKCRWKGWRPLGSSRLGPIIAQRRHCAAARI